MNKMYHKAVSPDHSSLSPEFILSHMLNARIDIELSSNYMSELITTSEISDLIRVRFEHLLARRDISARDIGLFQETHLSDARAISEAIASGERTFSEFLPLLRKASRFKH
jgi:hypothetical protein